MNLYKICEQKLKYLNYSKRTSEIYLYYIGEFLSSIGNGNRGDKRRTYRCQDGYVVDHISGRRAKLKSILRGNLELLH